MGRRRTKHRHLPPRMQNKHGAFYYTAYIDEKVKWIRLSDNYGEALRLWAEYEGRNEPKGSTVGAAIDRYLVEVLAKKRPRTQTDYRRYAKTLRPVFGEVLLHDVRPHHIAQYLDRRKDRDGKPAPVAANREMAFLSSVYQQAIRWGWTDTNPCRVVSRNPERKRQRHIRQTEIEQLRAVISDQFLCIVDLVLITGLRKSDVLKIRLPDITQEGLQVAVSKTGRIMVFEWSDGLHRIVEQARLLRRRVSSMYLFCTRNGTPYTISGFDSIWRRALSRAGVSDLTFHDLRANALTEAQKRYGRDYAQLLADHESGDTTERYIRGRELRKVRPLE